MADSVQYLKINSTAGEEIAYPKTLHTAVYTTSNTTSGPTLADFIRKHSHTMADIVDLNINPDGQLLLQTLNVLVNGVHKVEYNGITPQTLDITLTDLGGATVGHNHDDRYALINHVHNGYAPLVHKHSISDITDFDPGSGGGGDIQALTVQINGFDNLVFDGKTPKTLNITPELITAADRSHTHSKLDITDLSMAKLSITLKNIRFDDATGSWVNEDTVVEYTGATDVFINLSADQIGAASIRHYHDDRYSKLDHNHDTSYYKKTEIDTKLTNNEISTSTNTISIPQTSGTQTNNIYGECVICKKNGLCTNKFTITATTGNAPAVLTNIPLFIGFPNPVCNMEFKLYNSDYTKEALFRITTTGNLQVVSGFEETITYNGSVVYMTSTGFTV